jgi:hypothetical protein
MAVMRPQGGLMAGNWALSRKNVHGVVKRSGPSAPGPLLRAVSSGGVVVACAAGSRMRAT